MTNTNQLSPANQRLLELATEWALTTSSDAFLDAREKFEAALREMEPRAISAEEQAHIVEAYNRPVQWPYGGTQPKPQGLPAAQPTEPTLTISSTLWCDECQKPTKHEKAWPDVVCIECRYLTATEHPVGAVDTTAPTELPGWHKEALTKLAEKWRADLQAVGGFDNDLLAVPAGGVKAMISAIEALLPYNKDQAAAHASDSLSDATPRSRVMADFDSWWDSKHLNTGRLEGSHHSVAMYTWVSACKFYNPEASKK